MGKRGKNPKAEFVPSSDQRGRRTKKRKRKKNWKCLGSLGRGKSQNQRRERCNHGWMEVDNLKRRKKMRKEKLTIKKANASKYQRKRENIQTN